jgi:hypothetical protein
MSDNEGDQPTVLFAEDGASGGIEYDSADTTTSVLHPGRLVVVLPRTLVKAATAPNSADGSIPSLKFVSLPHPKHRGDSLFALGAGDDDLYELQEHRRKFATTWFLGSEHVEPSSGLFIATPIDLTFFAVSLARTSASAQDNLFVSADDMLRRIEAVEQLLPANIKHRLAQSFSAVCDVKQSGGEDYFRFSETKFLVWASAKHKMLAASDELKGALLTSDPSVLNSVALDLIAEYVDPQLRQKLAAACGVLLAAVYVNAAPSSARHLEPKASGEDGEPAKRPRTEQQKPLAIRRLEKGGPPKGTPTLMAMFAKKQQQQQQQQL